MTLGYVLMTWKTRSNGHIGPKQLSSNIEKEAEEKTIKT